jgi:predicted ATPase
MVELAGLADPARVPDTVTQALGVEGAGQGDTTRELLDHLESKDLLLVLDNCEHLLEAASALAQGILQRAPRVRLLATSQEALRLPDEQQVRLAPLAVPEATDEAARASGAVALFEARARAADSRFALDAHSLPAVIDICRQLDGMPLAIEFAAARVPTLGLTTVRDRLDERFRMLTRGSRLAPGRHQTLRAVLEWSHALLDEPQQRVFRRLGVFAGGFTMALAQAVAADVDLDAWSVTDQLCALVDKSLVVADGDDPPRYGLLESARAFALEELAAAGETAALLSRHARAIQDVMAGVDEARLDGELTSDRYVNALLPELDNVRAAHAWASGPAGDAETAILIAARASALDALALESAPWLEGHRAQVEAGVGPEVAARYWLALFGGTIRDRVPESVKEHAELQAEAIYRDLGQERRVFYASLSRAGGYYIQGNAGRAREKLESLRPLNQGSLPALLRARFIHGDSCTARLEGDLPRALSLSAELIDMLVYLDDWGAELWYSLWRVDLLWQVGSLAQAATEVIRIVGQLESRPLRRQWTHIAYHNLIGVLSEAGRWQEASGFLMRFLPTMRGLKIYGWDSLAHLFWRRGQIEIAAQLLGAAEARVAEGFSNREGNEIRLVGEVGTALRSKLGAVRLEALLAAGAESPEEALHDLMVLALADPLLPSEEGRATRSTPAA